MSTTTATTLISNAGTDLGGLIYTAVGVVLGIAIALVGVGFAWRKLKKHATGNKF